MNKKILVQAAILALALTATGTLRAESSKPVMEKKHMRSSSKKKMTTPAASTTSATPPVTTQNQTPK